MCFLYSFRTEQSDTSVTFSHNGINAVVNFSGVMFSLLTFLTNFRVLNFMLKMHCHYILIRCFGIKNLGKTFMDIVLHIWYIMKLLLKYIVQIVWVSRDRLMFLNFPQ